jgi:peptidoglycan/xylan/chitin deacetylase (PgdA/CDA1 family)
MTRLAQGGTALLAATLAFIPGAPASAPAPAARAIALTFDDLPGVPAASLADLQDWNRRFVAALRQAHAPAIGFVNEARLQVDGERDARVALLRLWLDAGLDLGNHTEAHLGLTETPLAEYEDGVVRGEAVLRALLSPLGRRPIFFRHPFTQTGPTADIKDAFERFLSGRGYRIAPFTVEAADYMFAALYTDAAGSADAPRARDLEEAYLRHNDTMLDFFERLAHDEFGRDIPQILLAHVNRLNAAVLPRLLERLRARGYRFVTLEGALRDPAYDTPDRYVGPNGPSWLHRFSLALGKPMRLRDEPDPPAWVLEAYAARGAQAPKATAPPPGR